MEPIKNILPNAFTNHKTDRIKYIPYDINIAKYDWQSHLIQLTGNEKPDYSDGRAEIYTDLIKFAHGDQYGKLDINKNLFINGGTGTSKTTSMLILREYFANSTYKDGESIKKGFKCFKNGLLTNMEFQVFNSREIVSDYIQNGGEALNKYIYFQSILIDDFGTEPRPAIYFGTSMNVLADIVERRYEKGYITHFTSNLLFDVSPNFKNQSVKELYGDRVYSRIYETCNIITMKGTDLRIKNNEK